MSKLYLRIYSKCDLDTFAHPNKRPNLQNYSAKKKDMTYILGFGPMVQGQAGCIVRLLS